MLLELPKTPIVQVHTTNNRGFTPEEIAGFCVDTYPFRMVYPF